MKMNGTMKQQSKSKMWTFPDILAPEVAPLSLPLARHLYRYWIHVHDGDSAINEQEAQDLFLSDVQEKREHVYFVMDGFVRNHHEQDHLPHRMRYSTQWLRETLGTYTPNAEPIPSKTFNHWVSMGLVRNSRKGIPTPDSGAALCIMRMSIQGTKVLPHEIPAHELPWWCYAQEDVHAEIRIIPMNNISQFPPKTLIWTRWAGATWGDDDQEWMLLSNEAGSTFSGAIRFAGVTNRHGKTYYQITRKDLIAWRPELGRVLSTGPFLDDEIQAFARVALVQLAQTRIRSTFPSVYQD